MSRNNHVFIVGDVTGDIHYDVFRQDGRDVPFLRLYVFVKAVEGTRQVEGLRIVAYGPLAELAYAHLQKGSRVGVLGHIQMRFNNNERIVEVAAEDVQFIRNIDWERGEETRRRLVERGQLRPTLQESSLPAVAG